MRGVAFGNVKGKVIRTYNYKRGTVIDHRTQKVADLKRVMNGELEIISEPESRRRK